MISKIACLECRKSKRKCDTRKPSCSACVRKGKECIYQISNRRKPATHVYTESLKNRIRVLEEALEKFTKSDIEGGTPSNEKYNPYPNLCKMNFRALKHWDMNSSPKNVAAAGDVRVNTTLWHLNIKDNRIFFEGPSSCRYISSANYANTKIHREKPNYEDFDDFHKEIFQWYFETMNKTLPLIDEQLFFSSINNSADENNMGNFASNSLINCIMALSYTGSIHEYKRFKDLAIKQVNEEVSSGPDVTTVQVLLLLSIIEMTAGNEFSSSDFMSRAVSACYHLGLHVSSDALLSSGKLSEEEARLRDMVFWCCFLVDRLRSIILGMHPFIYCTDISISLPQTDQDDPKFEMMEVFRDTLCFLDIQFKILQDVYSATLSINEKLSNTESRTWINMEKKLLFTRGAEYVAEWKKNISSHSRIQNNQSLFAVHLRVYQLTYNILASKPLLVHPILSFPYNKDNNSPISTCTQSSIEIIQICSNYELNQSLLLYQFLYSIYLSSIICLFNCTSSNQKVRTESEKLFICALDLFEKYSTYAEVSNIYYSNLKIFEEKWSTSLGSSNVSVGDIYKLSSLNNREHSIQDSSNSNRDSTHAATYEPENTESLDSDLFYDRSWLDFSTLINSLFHD